MATRTEDVRHPDFILSKGSERLYLEATVTGSNPGSSSGSSSAAQILDWINSARDPNFYVRLRDLTAGDATPKRRQVTEPLEAWLRGLEKRWRPLCDAMERGEIPDSHGA